MCYDSEPAQKCFSTAGDDDNETLKGKSPVSRGAGRIERAIRELFDTHPDLAFITDELAEHCYHDAGAIERKHQVAVLRAAHKSSLLILIGRLGSSKATDAAGSF
jgi:hypothetical protein